MALLCLSFSIHLRAVTTYPFTPDNIPWSIVGSSIANQPGVVALTQDVGGKAGGMWDPCTINLNQSFDLTWDVFLGENTYGCGADGLAFVVQGDSDTVLGGPSAEHGYDSGTIDTKSFAVALDTWSNAAGTGGNYDDPPYQSLLFDENGQVPNAVEGCLGYGTQGVPTDPVTSTQICRPSISSTQPVMTDGQWHQIEFIYNASTYTLTVNLVGDIGNPRAVYQFTSNPVTGIMGGNPSVYFGFTAGTGGSFNYQMAALDSVSTVNGGPVPATCIAPTAVINPTDTAIVPTPLTCTGETVVPTFSPVNTGTISPTFSVSPTMTMTLTPAPTSCGTPVFVTGAKLWQGQMGTTSSFNFPIGPVATVSSALVIVMIMEEQTTPLPISVSYGGTPMVLYGSNTTNQSTYAWMIYSASIGSLPAGPQNVTITYAAPYNNQQTLVQGYIIGNASAITPGNSTFFTTSGANPSTWTDSINVAQSGAMLMDFLQNTQNTFPSNADLSAGQSYTGALATTSNDSLDSDTKTAASTGATTMGYNGWSDSGEKISDWLIEIDGISCGTNTNTPTSTSTLSYSPTLSFSATKTPSPTSSETLTPTPTLSFSATKTVTFSPTPSSTNTSPFTSTDTPTWSPSPSDTPSFTITATPSGTPTASNSATPTPTETPSVTFSDSPSATNSASPTPTATATMSFSGTPTATASASVTNSFSPSPSASPSDTFSGTPTPTPSETATNSFTATPSVSATPTASATWTVSPSFTVSPTITVSFTVSPTPVPVPFEITLRVFNSAGELVKTIFSGYAEVFPTSFNFSQQVIVTGSKLILPLTGSFSQGGVQIPGPLVWDTTNAGGQYVASGVYSIMLTTVNQFGQSSNTSEQIQVINDQGTDTLDVYNSAGEIVRSVSFPVNPPTNYPIRSIDLAQSKFAPQYDSQGNITGGALTITATDTTGTQVAYQWDGKNNQGQPVASGIYEIQMVYTGPAGASNTVAKQVLLIQTPSQISLSGSVVGPNPLGKGQDSLVVSYPPSPGLECVAAVYGLSGELVAQGDDQTGGGLFAINMHGLASGIYICHLQKRQGSAAVADILIKVAILK